MPDAALHLAAIAPVLAAITFTPDPIAFQLGPIPVYWYGVCYAIGLAAAYFVITREARRRGLDPRYVDNGIIIVGIAALIGGRLYHVIDQWHLYQDNLLKIVLPPYTGLGVYGGILTGVIATIIITRLWKQPFWKWADVIAPGLFVMQAIGRWGNFFNQELYGPPTNLPWGIVIDCSHRITDHGTPQYVCPDYPPTQAFQPLFLYESISGILGAITLLWIARRWGPRMRPGDLFLIFLIWYGAVRFTLESLRTGNWTFNGIPTAMLVSGLVVAGSIVALMIRHRRGAADGDRWGDAAAQAADEELYEVDEPEGDAATDGDDNDGAATHSASGTSAAMAPSDEAPPGGVAPGDRDEAVAEADADTDPDAATGIDAADGGGDAAGPRSGA